MSEYKYRTMTDLIKMKKDLIKKRKSDPAFDLAIAPKLEQIENAINAKVSKNDKSYYRNFFRLAKELLPPDEFSKIESVAGTRQYFHQSTGPAGH